MLDRIHRLLEEVEHFAAQSKEEVEEYRIRWLSKKGEISALFEDFRTVPGELKKEVGQKLNDLRTRAQDKINDLKERFESDKEKNKAEIDLSIPAYPASIAGGRHPLSLVRREIISIFSKLGFTVSDGNEIEDDWHNFTALNTPENHPARDMQDTFYVRQNPDMVLRTQTSSVQVHIMQNSKPPIRTISPGRVYRNEAISARAHCQFHQVEGFLVDKDVSFADLKGVVYEFLRAFFEKDIQVRFRPSYFPFTEPSAEVDIECVMCGGHGCRVCSHTGWLEVMGCGMIHPEVFKAVNIDSEQYSGFAFGMGVERLAMLRYGINDLRLFFENDLKFLEQFH